MIRASLALAGALALAGCVSDRVTLLENEPGSAVGAIAVLSPDGDDTVLNTINSQARLSGRNPRVRTLDQLDPAYTALMDTLPPPRATIPITFPIGEAQILEGQRAIIDNILALLADRPGAQIEVAGFTDSTDDAASNDALSKQRAEAVASELRKFGVPIDPEDAVGRGEDDAVAALGDNVSDESYRRVDVIIR